MSESLIFLPFSQLSTAVLKAWLKAQGMTQSGDKPTLWGRCKLRHRTTTLGLRTSDGDDPCSLNPAGLRKAAARAGLSPIGSNDELLIALVDHLAKSAPKAAAASSSSSSSDASSATGATSSTNSGASSGKLDPVALAEKVLSLADASVGDPILVLRLADLSLQASAPTAALRKAYLKLSLAIHPDRLSKSFPEATKAFQVLVTAFERATQPEGDGPGGDADDDAAMSGGRKGTAVYTTLRSISLNGIRSRLNVGNIALGFAIVEGAMSFFLSLILVLIFRSSSTLSSLRVCLSSPIRQREQAGHFEAGPEQRGLRADGGPLPEVQAAVVQLPP